MQDSGGYQTFERATNLQVAELRELLATFVEAAEIGLCLIVNDLVCADVATLGESFATVIALERSFASMAAFMCLNVVR
jgi:hypothetical protein